MKRSIAIGMVALFVMAGASSAMAANAAMIPNSSMGEVVPVGEPIDDPPGEPASEPADSFGPSPNSGDGIPDGSDLEPPNGPNAPYEP